MYDALQQAAVIVVIVNPSFSRVYGNDDNIDGADCSYSSVR